MTDARKLASRITVEVAGGKDPHADRLALRGRGSFAEVASRYVKEHASKKNKSWRQGDALVTRYLLPRWAKLDIGNIRRTDVRSTIAAITKPVLANQVLAAASAVFNWAVRQDIIPVNPCSGVERNNTASRERILGNSEIAVFWPHLTAPLRMILLTGQRPGEVAHLHQQHVVDGKWWVIPGKPDPATSWPGTKNGMGHQIWLAESVRNLLTEVLAAPIPGGRMQRDMHHLCLRLGVKEKGDSPRSTPDILQQGHRTRVWPRGDEPNAQPQGRRHRRRLRSAPLSG